MVAPALNPGGSDAREAPNESRANDQRVVADGLERRGF